MAGEGPPLDKPPEAIYGLHSGLAYPLAYIAKAVSFVFNISPTDSLDVVCKFVPPLLGIISMVVIYLVATRIWNRKVGLFSALAWAVMLHPVFVGAAGYLDRDGLTIFLLMVGGGVFYLSKDWRLHVGRRDVGWLVAGLGVLMVEALLYLEWGFVGPLLLLAVVAAYFLVKLLVRYDSRTKTEQLIPRMMAAMVEANWRPFALIVAVNIVVAGLSQGTGSWLSTALLLTGAQGGTGVTELSGIAIADLVLGYGLLLIPMAIGIYLAWKKRSDGAIFFACWFLCLLILSLFARRVLFFAAPAAVVLCGLGLAFLWDWRSTGQYQILKKVGVVAFLCILLLVSFSIISTVGTDPLIAVDEDWGDALAYIRGETPQDSVIMTQWGWGYFILDVGQRKPFMDNGFYGYDGERMRDVALAYLAKEPPEAVQIMDKYGADYLIFSKLDLAFAGTIMGWAGLDNEEVFPADTLVIRSLNGEFEAQGDLRVVYRSVPYGEVVILGLTRSE
jgi:asparagine N-glycosylation enzyme membrane subunit Stt3